MHFTLRLHVCRKRGENGLEKHSISVFLMGFECQLCSQIQSTCSPLLWPRVIRKTTADHRPLPGRSIRQTRASYGRSGAPAGAQCAAPLQPAENRLRKLCDTRRLGLAVPEKILCARGRCAAPHHLDKIRHHGGNCTWRVSDGNNQFRKNRDLLAAHGIKNRFGRNTWCGMRRHNGSRRRDRHHDIGDEARSFEELSSLHNLPPYLICTGVNVNPSRPILENTGILLFRREYLLGFIGMDESWRA